MTALGLQKEPFSTESDSLFYFPFDSFEQRLKVLHGVVQGKDLLVLVIGEPGSGKTTLLNRYLASTDTKWKSARILRDPETAATQSSKPQAQGGYPAYVLQDAANPIVIVDDAHRLPQKEFEFLIQEALVPGRPNKIKRLVLFGESELYTAVTKLAATLSAQPAVSKISLPGLTVEQTADYLQHRLAVGGYSGETPFTSSAIKDIHQASGGYLGPIIEIAHQWLNEKYSRNKEGHHMLQKRSATPRRMVTWIAAAVIILSLGALWLFLDRKPSTSKAPAQQVAKTVFRKKIVPDFKLSERTVTKKIAAVETPAKPPAVIEPQQSPEATPPAKPPTPIKTVPPERKEPAAPGPIITAAQKTESQPKTEPQPVANPLQKTESQPKTEPQPVANPLQKIDSRPKTEPQSVKKPPPKTAAREIRREKWLLSQEPAHYTIQVLGVSYEKSMLEFINKNQLLKKNEIAFYESTFNGKPWFQLLYGIYPTRQDARLAAEKLPENIRQTGPWIRRLSGVQQTIEKR